MILNRLKKRGIFFVTIFAAVSARAQTGFPRNGFNDNKFGIGASASVIRGYTNLAKQNNEFAFGLNFIYNYQPFLPVSLELQAGRLSGGGLLKSEDRDGRKYVNNYKVLIFHVDYQLGEGMDEMEIETDNSWFLQRVREC